MIIIQILNRNNRDFEEADLTIANMPQGNKTQIQVENITKQS